MKQLLVKRAFRVQHYLCEIDDGCGKLRWAVTASVVVDGDRHQVFVEDVVSGSVCDSPMEALQLLAQRG